MAKIIKINPDKPDLEKIDQAAEVIKKGGLVIFPTETVYGIGADVYNTGAVKKIFQVKKRSSSKPLTVHIARKSDMEIFAKEIPDYVYKLVNKFWPGPLTIILRKKKIVDDIVTSGFNTVGLRMPAYAIPLALIKRAGAIAAPSANMSGEKSPSSVKDIISGFGDDKNIDLIIDSGRTPIGVASTVIDATVKPFKVLRYGSIKKESIERAVR